MKRERIEYYSVSDDINNILHSSDFNYLSDEFNIVEDNLGIELISKKDPNLIIYIRDIHILYSRNSELDFEFVFVRSHILFKIGKVDWYKKYIPTTTEQLANLIDEFKYEARGTVTEDTILNFLSNNLVN